MEIKEAVEIIKKNWPDAKYSMLREALQVVLDNLSTSDNSQSTPYKCSRCSRFSGCRESLQCDLFVPRMP